MYRSPSAITNEYSRRMQQAIADARLLGLSEDYLTYTLGPLISRKETDAQVPLDDLIGRSILSIA